MPPQNQGEKQFDNLAEKLCDLLWKQPVKSEEQTLYHYTTAAGLEGVLRKKRIWATDCRFLNDRGETEIGLSKAKSYARELYFSAPSSSQNRAFYKHLREALGSDDPEKNFIFSLSTRRDDLSQWRAYANGGAGFTIGFDKQAIIAASNRDSQFGFAKVSYSAATHERRIKRAINEYEELLSELAAKNDYDILSEAASSLETVLVTFATMYKHSSFKAEDEWRTNSFVDSGDPKHDIQVRVSGERLIPYIEIDLCDPTTGCLPIKEIGVGPGFQDSAVDYAVEKLCRSYDATPTIYNADTPYRRM